MKNRLIIATSVALALSNQYAIAGSIADTYATGDTLTAAKMDNIKAAVNGNDLVNGEQTIAIGANADDIVLNTGNIAANANNIAIKPVTACSASVFSFGLSGTTEDITSVSITVGGPGVVLVTGNTSLSVTSTGAAWEGDIYVSDTSASSNSNARRQWWVPAGMPAGSTATPAHVQGIFTVPSAGTYTYYFTGMHFFTTVVSANKSTICAAFTPN